MSAVPTATSVSVRAPRALLRRYARASRSASTAVIRRRPSSIMDIAPDPVSVLMVPALLALAALAAFAVLCLPALHVELALGWLPLWLLTAPLSAAAALGVARQLGRGGRALRR